MNMNIWVIIGLVIFTLSAGVYFIIDFQERERQSVGLRVCPEAWYENRMPGPGSGEGGFEQYFVINGERVEVYEVDVPWVQENCEVNSPQPVY